MTRDADLRYAIHAMRREVHARWLRRPGRGFVLRPAAVARLRSLVLAIRALEAAAARGEDEAIDEAYPYSGGEA